MKEMFQFFRTFGFDGPWLLWHKIILHDLFLSYTFCFCRRCSRSDLSGGVHRGGREGPMGHGAAQIGPGTLRVVHGAAAEEEILTFVVPPALS